MGTKDKIPTTLQEENAEVSNRYELDQRRGTRTTTDYPICSNSNREIASRRTGRDYSENRGRASIK
jgi:hypothetical protein